MSFVSFNVTVFLMHLVGIIGMSRRLYTYPADLGWSGFNTTETIGSFLLAVSIALFLINVLWSVGHGAVAGDNPWGAFTLEWSTSSRCAKMAVTVRARISGTDSSGPRLELSLCMS